MLGRTKFKFDDLVNEILDQLPVSVWKSKKTTFLDPAMGGGQFVKEIERRLRDAGHSDTNISERVFGWEVNNMRINFAKKKYNLIGTYEVGGLEKDMSKKFDVIVGNPPFQDKKGNENSTNSADLFTKFVNKSFDLVSDSGTVSLIIPSAWSGPRNSSLKTVLFERHQPSIFNTHEKKWFNVNMNTCYFVTQKNRKGKTLITDNYGNSIEVILNSNSSIFTNLSFNEIYNKIIPHLHSNLGDRWNRGSLNLNDVVEKSEGVVFIKAVGKKNEGLETCTIEEGTETTGFDIDKVVIPNLGSSESLGNIKISDKKEVGGHSVVFLFCSNSNECVRLKEYLNSKFVRYLVKNLKISTPNSKNIFSKIPTVDLSRSWTDEELYEHFNLTQKEIDLIEETVK